MTHFNDQFKLRHTGQGKKISQEIDSQMCQQLLPFL